MITLNAIEQRLRQFAENHFFIHSYGFGSPDEVDLDKYTAFPLLYVVYTGATYDDNKAYSFEVYVLDRPTEQEAKSENRREVVSDSEQCLEDLVADITTGFNVFQWDEAYNVEAASVSPIVDARTNVLSGALLDLTISVPYQYESCNLPIDGVQPQGGEISYARRGLLRILTQDGATDVPSVNTIKVTNGTLTDEGDGIVSIDTGGVDILGDLENVNLDDPHDREALVYDEETQSWINDGIGKVVIPIFNTTYEDIIPGRPLQAAGSQGDRIAAEPFDFTKSTLQYIGHAETLIPARSNGHALVYGEIRGLDTSQWPVGQLLQVGSNITNTAPFAMRYYADGFSDQPLVSAMVTRSHENTGRIFVRMWSPGYRPRLESLDDVQADNPYLGATLYWSGQDWRYRPQTSKFIVDFAQDLTEIYYYATPLDAQEYRTPRSDTPSEGNKIVRKIWYTPTAQANIDTADWILLETLEDNALYSDVISAFTAALNTSPGGDTPISIKTTWEEVPALTGILDGYTADLVGAFAPVLLVPDYAGDCIRIRRASDNAETDIGFDGIDLDTTAIATFCAGTDGFVKTWYNQDGSGNDLLQTSTGAQPKIYDASTGVELDNLKPAISYDTSSKLLEAPLAIAHVPLSVFIVQSGPATQADITFNLGNTSNGNEHTRLQSNAGAAQVQQLLARSVADGLAAANISDNFDQGLITIISKATNDRNIGVNGGTFVNLSTSVTTVNSTFLRLGENSTEEIKQQAVIIYTADKSADRTAIESALNGYFNIYP